MSGIVDAVLNLSGVAAYTVVALLAFGEAAALIGLVLPGELAVLLGGVVASSGNASLPVMIAVASLAAIAGDSVGYEVGRHAGPRILAWPPFARRFGSKVTEAAAYLERRGGRAVFLGRWTSLLRALVPGLAGMARMPYGRFLVWNVVGGIAWATTFVALGYLAGSSWRQVERIAGRASLLLLGLIVLGFLIRWLTRRLSARADEVRAHLDRLATTRPARWVRTRFARPLAWAGHRLRPGASRGLGWTLSVAVAGASAWVLGIAVQDLFAREELALLDRPVATWFAAHATAASTDAARIVVAALGPPFGLWVVLLLAAVAWRSHDRASAIRVVVAAVLTAALALVLAQVLPLSVAGTRFPAVAVAWLTAASVAAVPAVAARDLGAAIRLTGATVALVALAATAELGAGVAALSGVVGGAGAGALIAVGGELTARTLDRETPGATGPVLPT